MKLIRYQIALSRRCIFAENITV